MKRSALSGLGIASSSAFVLAGLGCGGVSDDNGRELDPTNDTAQTSDDLARTRVPSWPWHRRVPRPVSTNDGGVTPPPTDAGSNGSGGTSAGDTKDCGLCETARACCNAVSGGPLCTFSRATCESLDDVARAAYVNSCTVLLDTVTRARTTLPSSCL